jgi:hypothetical protein
MAAKKYFGEEAVKLRNKLSEAVTAMDEENWTTIYYRWRDLAQHLEQVERHAYENMETEQASKFLSVVDMMERELHGG